MKPSIYLFACLPLLVASHVFSHYLMFKTSLLLDVLMFVCIGVYAYKMDKLEKGKP